DLVVDQRTAETTEKMTENSLRSVAIADDLRYQAYRLSTANLTPDQIASIAEQIDADARAYDPLVTTPTESREFDRLQSMLAHLRHEQPIPTSGSSATLISEIETSIARLVTINQAEARRDAATIGDAHRGGLVIDAIVGGVTIILAGLVALVLLRALSRQRALLRVHLASLGERNRELNAFAARTAHDLKGPLSPLKGYADLLSLREEPEVREIARRIQRASERMTGIIEDLLELSVHGKPVPGKVTVTPVVLELLDELRAELRDVEVKLELGDCTTACSANVLAQILRNVIVNAAKYRSPSRQLLLRITARIADNMVELTITDNGIGMDADTAAHAFEPLYRAPGASSPGHGLGLAIVRRTVQAVGGTVALTSTKGEGTQITVRVPAA
ncbi:MAG: HAMP domain-containing histidine kinase, partial [Deltaproteobacteria bacterium]|nr:HAMP domain-containing histidine kinase [Deltaproteobacteria bacterium]